MIISDFPPEIIYEITSFLSFHDLINFRITCSLVNQIGVGFLNSKTTLVSAFWSYCQFQKLRWIQPETIEMFKLNKIWFFHHSENSPPFVVAESPLIDKLRFNCLNLQLYFSSENKILTIESTPFIGSFSMIEKYNLIEMQTNLINQSDLIVLQNKKHIRIGFNCFKPIDQHCYYKVGNCPSEYIYVFDKHDLELTITTEIGCMDVNKTIMISNDLVKIVFLFNDSYLLNVFINFASKKLIIGECFRIPCYIPRESTFLDGKVCSGSKLTDLILEPCPPLLWVHLSLVERQR